MPKMKSKKDTDEYLKKRREQKKLCAQKRRERERADPEKHEKVKENDRARYMRDKNCGKKKPIKDMTKRQQRATRKAWKKSSQNYRDKKKVQKVGQDFIEPATSRDSPLLLENTQNDNPCCSKGKLDGRKKKARKYAEKKRKELKLLKEQLEKVKREKSKYKSRYYRLKQQAKETIDTPKRKLKEIEKSNPNLSDEIKKSLLFKEVITKQIRHNVSVEKSKSKKRLFSDMLNGPVIERYKFKKYLEILTSKRSIKNDLKDRKIKKGLCDLKKVVTKYLEEDSSSRMTPGKKETITRKKLKKQKRFLNDSLKNLHKKFQKDNKTYKNISYSLFCKLRPFWVMVPNISTRETCLCKKHSNISLLTSKLKYLGMIKENTPNELEKSFLVNKKITYNEYDPTEMTTYHQWCTKIESVQVKGNIKRCQKTVKIEKKCTKDELVAELEKQIQPFIEHCNNIKTQYKAITDLKNGLKIDEAILHFDFSENYGCKYSEEIQSAHFGGSKSQITLHTSVLYFIDDVELKLNHKSFCTVSDSLRHDPVAICAHLDPILKHLKNYIHGLSVLHFVSDGPVTQYRNKNMFNLLVTYILKQLQVKEFTWNYTEAGHGKGAPDGVGGAIKRTADLIVARGRDIPDLETFVSLLRDSETMIEIFVIPTSNINEINKMFDEPSTPFKGTMSIHQLVWNCLKPQLLEARRLSCLICQTHERCHHFHIGWIEVLKNMTSRGKLRYKEVYSSSSDDGTDDGEDAASDDDDDDSDSGETNYLYKLMVQRNQNR